MDILGLVGLNIHSDPEVCELLIDWSAYEHYMVASLLHSEKPFRVLFFLVYLESRS